MFIASKKKWAILPFYFDLFYWMVKKARFAPSSDDIARNQCLDPTS